MFPLTNFRGRSEIKICSDQMDIFDVSWNDLSGEIPLSITNCRSIRVLSLGFNRLNGSIPVEIGNLKRLSILKLGNNILEGAIPAELGTIELLQVLNSAVELFQQALVKSVVAWAAMITGFLRFGKIESAAKLFDDMPIRNLITWNAMIAGYVENFRAEDGLKLFKRMVSVGIRPNPSSFSSVLLGCSSLSALELGKQIHQLICISPLHLDTTVGTSLLSMYCKCWGLEEAWKLFSEMPLKDVVTWNAMISGYAQHGSGKKAIWLFDEMKDKGIKPDWITFVAVLLACNHAGLVDLGIQHFDSMKRDYKIEAKPDHYRCMVSDESLHKHS